MKGKHVILSFVLFVSGFIVALSYQITSERQSTSSHDETQWRYEDDLRSQIIESEEFNMSLQEEISEKQSSIRELESQLANVSEEEEVRNKNLIDDIERLRKIAGTVPVHGPGIEISLEDSEYLPTNANPNDYIVHEEHVQKVIDELFVSQAEAVAINGYRLTNQSYIKCVGPVILVDGHVSTAPFTISAIGEPDTLLASIEIHGGVLEQLVNDGITVRTQKQNHIEFNSYLSERGG
ncbi:DUF881 domain-containing protein [Alkalihalobacillus pseudalcaliphilus]|uniref:DUF881 domain-containing protein n=1 Tax=Alkalihalobacillus pseudalcaliphilus TaxID=79884 RepID=UPI0030811100